VCILLLSRKPVVVSSSRLFAPGHSGVTPRASYLVLEIGLSVMHAAADTLSKLTSDISVFHRDPRFDVISIIRNRLLRFYVCTLSCAEARAGSSRSSRRKNHISNSPNETLFSINDLLLLLVTIYYIYLLQYLFVNSSPAIGIFKNLVDILIVNLSR